MSDASGRLRADKLLVERGLFPSRARAAAEIKAGTVRAGGVPVRSPSQSLPIDIDVELAAPAIPYVSRAGLKLAQGLDRFALVPAGAIALDIGASTGGFTDVLLQRDARKVYAVDVGHDQLAPKLRNDPRVVALEGINARALSDTQVPDLVDCVVADVSFISLTHVLPPAFARARAGAWCVALVKPQFEAGRDKIGKGGVVRDAEAQRAAVERVALCVREAGWRVLGDVQSPIAGSDGNREWLLAARKDLETGL